MDVNLVLNAVALAFSLVAITVSSVIALRQVKNNAALESIAGDDRYVYRVPSA